MKLVCRKNKKENKKNKKKVNTFLRMRLCFSEILCWHSKNCIARFQEGRACKETKLEKSSYRGPLAISYLLAGQGWYARPNPRLTRSALKSRADKKE